MKAACTYRQGSDGRLFCHAPGSIDPDGEGLLCAMHAEAFAQAEDLFDRAVMGALEGKDVDITVLPDAD